MGSFHWGEFTYTYEGTQGVYGVYRGNGERVWVLGAWCVGAYGFRPEKKKENNSLGPSPLH